MSLSEPVATYLELRESEPDGREAAGLSHRPGGLVLLHVLELAAFGEPLGGVTIVHTAGEHGGRHLPLARHLAGAGWAVALPDLRGHGRSEGERGHSAGQAEIVRDLRAVQDHLAYRLPDAPRYLVGHGLGAVHAAHYALHADEPPAGLVLLAPLLRPRFRLPEPPRGLRRLFGRGAPPAGSIGHADDQLSADPAQRAARAADELVHDVVSLRAASEAARAAAELRERVGEIGVPVLVLQGSEDPIADPRDALALAGGPVAVEVLAGRRHDPLHDVGAQEVLERIAAWLGGLRSA